MRADAVVGDVAAVEQLDQERPRHVEDVGGLLGRQLPVVRDQGDREPLRHVTHDRSQRGERRGGNLDLASVGSDQPGHRPLPPGGDPGELFAQLDQLVLLGRIGTQHMLGYRRGGHLLLLGAHPP